LFLAASQIDSERNPNPAKSGSNLAKPDQNKTKKMLGFPSPNRALSRGYADPHGLFLFMRRFRLKGGPGTA
jgi:hypothetical protein